MLFEQIKTAHENKTDTTYILTWKGICCQKTKRVFVLSKDCRMHLAVNSLCSFSENEMMAHVCGVARGTANGDSVGGGKYCKKKEGEMGRDIKNNEMNENI